jgi:hypothetical protein
MPFVRTMPRPLLYVVLALALLVAGLAFAPSPTSAAAAAAEDRSQAGPSSTSATQHPTAMRKRLAVPGTAITFAEVDEGTWVTDEYVGQGVVFTSDVFTTRDTAATTNPVLSGYPKFTGDIDGYFTTPGTSTPATVTGFSLDLGFIDSRNSVQVFAYNSAGALVTAVKAQSEGFNHIDVRYAGIASFSVQIIDDEPKGFEIDNLAITRDGTGIVPTRMASFGDSYSSGEGLIGDRGLRYDCGTDLYKTGYRQDTTMLWAMRGWDASNCDTRKLSNKKPADLFKRPMAYYENRCHRHRRAYPNAIRQRLGIVGSSAIFVACSGTKTEDIVSKAQYGDPGSPVNVAGGQTQLATVQGFAARGAPDFVTVGIGGNDAGFEKIIEYCLLNTCADDEEWKEGKLEDVEGTMYAAAEGTFRRLRGDFATATIAAFGYPSVIGDPAVGCAGYNLVGTLKTIDEAERSWLKYTVFPAINDSLREAATAAGVSFIDIAPATAGHEICSAKEWVNGFKWGSSGTWWKPVAPESFHPNELAHDAIASYFISHYMSNGHLIFTNPEQQAPILPVLDSPINHGDLSAGGLQGGTEVPCIQACPLTIQGEGYQPGSVVHLTVGDPGGSERRRARATAVDVDVAVDDTGAFTRTVQLPAGTRAGIQGVELSGVTDDGVPQFGTAFFQVFSKRPPSLGIARVRLDPPRKLRLHGRTIKVRCTTTVDTSCKVRARVKAGRRAVVATGAKRTGTDGRVTVVLRFTKREVRVIAHALGGKRMHKGLRVQLSAKAPGLTQTGHDRAKVRLVRAKAR